MPISKITGQSIEDGSIVLADLGITTFNTGAGNTLTLQANSATGITIDVTGNTAIANTLSFTGTGARIRGDFNSTPTSNRVLFQNSVANTNTSLGAIPNGTGTTSQFIFNSSSDPTNASRFRIGNDSTSSFLVSDLTGTGTNLPITFLTAGSERLRIDTSGNMMLGVTTASSSTKFDVYGTSSAAHIGARVTNAATDGYSTLWLSSSNDGLVRGGSTAAAFTSELAMLTSGSIPLTFYTANTKRMTIGATGNIGIGTTSPSQLLHVAAGTILTSNTAGTIATVSIAGNGSTVGTSDFALQQGTSSEAYVYNRANSFLVIGTNNTERMRITSGGNVGIGTTNPQQKLVVSNNGGAGLEISPDAIASSPCLISYNRSGAAYTQLQSSALLHIWDTSGTERMRIASDGKVGIGTSSPAYLQQNHSTTENDVALALSTTSNSSTAGSLGLATRLRIGAISSATNNGVAEIRGLHNLYQNALSALTFLTNDGSSLAERMRITSGGNVGIGITNPDVKLVVFGTTGTNGDAVRNMLILSSETAAAGVGGGISFGGYYDGTSSPVNDFAGIQGFKENGTANNFAGALRFTTRVNGGLPTERMRITSNGNVGIGITTPGTDLQINDTTTMGTGTATANILSLTNNNGVNNGVAGDKLGILLSAMSDLSDRRVGLYTVAGNTNWNNPDFAIWQTGQGIAFRETFRIKADSGNLQFNSGYGSVATAYGVRAWISFNGSSGAINGSGNVSSVTNNATGDWTINFSTAMPDGNYSIVGMVRSDNDVNPAANPAIRSSDSPGTGSCRVMFGVSNSRIAFTLAMFQIVR